VACLKALVMVVVYDVLVEITKQQLCFGCVVDWLDPWGTEAQSSGYLLGMNEVLYL
jgi:hypothetical protein